MRQTRATARRILVAAALVLLATTGLWAQNSRDRNDTGTRTVSGVVSDADGKPVPGAVVYLKDTKTLAIRTFYAQADGSYHFAGLGTNNDYELKAEHGGASSGTKTLTSFDSRKTAVIDLKLKPQKGG
jgi:hypothetical protein